MVEEFELYACFYYSAFHGLLAGVLGLWFDCLELAGYWIRTKMFDVDCCEALLHPFYACSRTATTH
jgi:hypothetical protein